MNKRVEVNFYGRVQGVWFRKFTRDRAVELGLTGIVKNEPGGSVYAVFEGPEETIAEAVEWCKHKQPYARVERTDLTWHNDLENYRDFTIQY